jgi:hypothetical protein
VICNLVLLVRKHEPPTLEAVGCIYYSPGFRLQPSPDSGLTAGVGFCD